MAFSAITTRGSATEKTSDTSLGMSPSANLTVGKIVFIHCATDNDSSAVSDGASSRHSSVTDSQGNTWNKISEYTDSDGSAADGVTNSIWWCKVTTQIGTGDTITLTVASAVTNKIISCFEVTSSVGLGITIEQVGVGQSAISASVSSLPSREYLLIGAFAAEGNDSTKTADADYNERFDLRTGSGTAATEIATHVQTRIATLTSDTCTSTGWTNTNPIALLVAAYETPNTAPTVALNSPADTGSVSDTTPDLTFTGTDANSDEIEYEVQVDTVNTFDSIAGGSFAVWNSADKDANVTLSEGDLRAAVGATTACVRATIGKSSGKWYWEVTLNTVGWHQLGIAKAGHSLAATLGQDTNSASMWQDDGKVEYNTAPATTNNGAGSNGDVIGLALDLDAGTLKFYRNGSLLPDSLSGFSGTFYPAYAGGGLSSNITANFGDSAFAYTPPAGYIGLTNPTYATLNPSDKDADVTLSGGDLVADGTNVGVVRATQGKSSGKWYWEVELTTGTFDCFIGVANASCTLNANLGSTSDGWSLVQDDGGYFHNGFVDILAAYTTTAGDIIGVALDMDSGTLSFYKNGSLLGGGPLLTGLTGTLYPALSIQFNTITLTVNFGASAFAYDPPTGYASGFYDAPTGGGSPIIDAVSETDSGFVDVTDGADTHPFDSGDQITYTVQAGDALPDDTYYWRVRAKDPSGSNGYGAWSSTRSFDVTSSTTTTKTETGVARIEVSTTKTETGVARVTATTTRTETGIARITVSTTKTESGVSLITATTQQTISGVADIENTTTRTETGVADILKATTRTIDGVARVEITSSQTIDGIARITTSTTKTETGLARITATTTKTETGTADILKSTSRTIDGVANIIKTATRDITGTARIEVTATQTEDGVARIETSVIKTETGLARITVSTTQTEDGVAKITTGTTQNITGVADIENTTTKTETGVARIEVTSSQSETGVARIEISSTQVETGISRITASTTKTIDGTADILATTTKTEDGVARVTNSATKTETGVSRVEIATTRTETGLARITASTGQNEAGKARITASSTKTETGKARITNTATQTETGVARITVSTTKTEAGISRITASATKNITGIARITATSTKTETGKARVTAIATQTETGIGRVEKASTQTIDGTGFILVTITKTETGVASIFKPTTQDITGVALILPPVAQGKWPYILKTKSQKIVIKNKVEEIVMKATSDGEVVPPLGTGELLTLKSTTKSKTVV